MLTALSGKSREHLHECWKYDGLEDLEDHVVDCLASLCENTEASATFFRIPLLSQT